MTELSLEGLAARAAQEASHPHGVAGEIITPVNSSKNRPMYASRVKVYPKLVHGFFRKMKWIVMAVTLGIYYLTPWLRWHRGPGLPDQAVLLDFAHSRFYFFFIEIWPEEIYYITGLLILAAIGLFLVTSVAGRVWCGYTCPQTVWTDLFIHVERWIEGDRSARIRLDREGWSVRKLFLKVSKHIVWLLIALATGGAWVFYFADAPALADQLWHLDAPVIAWGAIAAFTASTYLLGGIAREQVCIYMCPWPRIQGAMFDEESLLVSYKADRGELRGPHKKGTSWEGRGDCIDCGQCVVACPMGIDIRDGMQLECIQCALCIDACNDIMDRIERPRGLIGYDTLSNPDRRRAGLKQRFRIARPRTLVYAAAMLLVGGIMLYALTHRQTLELNVLPDRNPLFVTLSDGSIRNGYTLKIQNKELTGHNYRVSIVGLDGARLIRAVPDEADPSMVLVGADTLRAVKYFIALPPDKLSQVKDGEAAFSIRVTRLDDGTITETETGFRGPQ
ncbi:MAG: cytochrome c oxidase accessory protein CcoG [Parvibaculaceae bacterium]|nr:cytochrome c oxidase accessory protein CcoG [Parvibaculaceae bacterium]